MLRKNSVNCDAHVCIQFKKSEDYINPGDALIAKAAFTYQNLLTTLVPNLESPNAAATSTQLQLSRISNFRFDAIAFSMTLCLRPGSFTNLAPAETSTSPAADRFSRTQMSSGEKPHGNSN